MKWGVRRNRVLNARAKGKQYAEKQKVISESINTRKTRGRAGPGTYLTEKTMWKGHKAELDLLNRGGHLSFGITKKRQKKFDEKDIRKITDDLDKLNADQYKKTVKKGKNLYKKLSKN